MSLFWSVFWAILAACGVIFIGPWVLVGICLLLRRIFGRVIVTAALFGVATLIWSAIR